MHGDKLLIRSYHTRAAKKVSKVIIPEILSSSSRYVVTIAGESGTGKTEIAHELAKELKNVGIRSLTLHQDDYFKLPPQTNHKARRKDISLVGMHEVKLSLLNEHLNTFKDARSRSFRKPIVYFNEDKIKKETLRYDTEKVLIVDGTYTTALKNVDKKVFLARTYKDTEKARRARKRDKIDSFDKKILAIEHRIISGQNKLADITVKKDYTLPPGIKPDIRIKRICMITIHGYVDAKPILGKTDTGGQVTYVLELSKALAKHGIKVDIYTRQFMHKKTIEPVARGVRIIRIPCCGQGFVSKEKIFPCLDTFVKNMERFIDKEGLDYQIFHSHYWDAGYVAMKLTERLGCFFVHTFHSLGAWKKEHMGGAAKEMERLYNFRQRIKVERQIFKKAKALTMTSTDMIRHSRKFYNYKKHDHIVLPAGVNTSIFRPLKKGAKEKKIDVPQNYIFWVGRFDTNKGLDYLLRGFAEVVTKAKDLFLVIGGGSKKPKPAEKQLRENLHKMIEDAQLKNRVFFVKYIKDSLVPSYYRKATFFVLPSKFEPFGMTGAEAMACGTPLIVSKRAGITRYLKNKHNCLTVNPSNKKDLSWAFTVLNRNQSFRKKIARNGCKLAREEFGWTKIANTSLDFYRELLEKL